MQLKISKKRNHFLIYGSFFPVFYTIITFVSLYLNKEPWFLIWYLINVPIVFFLGANEYVAYMTPFEYGHTFLSYLYIYIVGFIFYIIFGMLLGYITYKIDRRRAEK